MAFGDLGAILRLGVRAVLDEADFTVVDDVAVADAVVIDLDEPACLVRASGLLERHPHVLVLACSADRPAMRAFTASGAGAERSLTPVALTATLSAV